MTKTRLANPEFEQKPTREIEKKYLPVFPESLLELREQARPIEQFYLSHPSEQFSLRMREEFTANGELSYTATLKDRGELMPDGQDRLEVEVPITAELYQYYKTDVPVLRKLRAYANNGVMVDYYEDGHVQVESENPIAWTNFIDRYGDSFMDMTGQQTFDNEWRAHLEYRRSRKGEEVFIPSEYLKPEEITRDILERLHGDWPVFAKIRGRSGSGKSTIVRQVQQLLSEYGVVSEVISTDDYHRGATWLRQYNNGRDWAEWDHPIVYDTVAMANDLKLLKSGVPIERRRIDFGVVEPVFEGKITPVPVVLIEGIYAGHQDFNDLESLDYEMPTPLGTCIGRRLLRDMRERPDFADPRVSLAYMLEQAEPMYRAQGDV